MTNKMDSKISVIVPVYNVEQYLPQCLESIINQTYNNLEIILVNDGSTDTSGTICEHYALQDNRIKVITKPNGGLSSARNVGLQEATGEFIAFVDSDDWLEPDIYQTSIELFNSEEAIDIVIFHFAIELGKTSQEFTLKRLPNIITGKEAAYAYECDDIAPAVWYKIYRRHIAIEELFPEGRVYEDIAYTYKVLLKSRQIAVLRQVGYHYRRDNVSSISHTVTSKILDMCRNITELRDEFLRNGAKEQAIGANTLFTQHLRRYFLDVMDSPFYPEYHKYIKSSRSLGINRQHKLSFKIIHYIFQYQPKLSFFIEEIIVKLHNLKKSFFSR